VREYRIKSVSKDFWMFKMKIDFLLGVNEEDKCVSIGSNCKIHDDCRNLRDETAKDETATCVIICILCLES
jgi:hypothetical protein